MGPLRVPNSQRHGSSCARFSKVIPSQMALNQVKNKAMQLPEQAQVKTTEADHIEALSQQVDAMREANLRLRAQMLEWLGPPGLVQQGVAVPGVGGVVPQDADAEHEARLIQNLRNIVGEDWI